MTPEGKVKEAVKAVIAMVPGTWSHWPVQSGMGAPTLDCVGARPCDGRAFAVETKRPGKRHTITAQQRATARAMLAGGVTVFCIDGKGDLDLRLFEAWLKGRDDLVIAHHIRERIHALVDISEKDIIE
jgi:hypothetical protein